MQPLVSIIIPTYNRAHLLGETLESVLAQTYTNWECIVVDDGSTDYTKEMMEFCCEKDKRIQYHHRPMDRPKGANACRNYGFELSKGDFVNWFDSDDLMNPAFIQEKIRILLEKNVDYVISFSRGFKSSAPKLIETQFKEYYTFDTYPISNFNYVTQRNNWLTCDFMGARQLLEKISFNENLQAFQERNFFCKLTCYSVKAEIIPAYFTHVRIHQNSTQNNLKKDTLEYHKKLQEFFFCTWKDLKRIAPSKTVEYLFARNLDYSMYLETGFEKIHFISHKLLELKKFKAFYYYILFQLVFHITGKGYQLRKKVLKYQK